VSDSAEPDPHVTELEAAARHRRQSDLAMSMSERLAALHELCKQLTVVEDANER
jgi:hypothetical protein